MNLVLVLVGALALLAALPYLLTALGFVLHVVEPKPSASERIAAEAHRKHMQTLYPNLAKPTSAAQANQD